ncbi:chaperonin 10-like protein [Roridomyces roridus]|uniref:Chaperonin 10-like protein n=1 Tax=Roridomyces roridus TaxID=1738132 RepID=A0AAD7C8G9_9AGAR|nr:chaperonin 10-like protein [Roridomyces roridus]
MFTQKALVLKEKFGQFVVDSWPMPPPPAAGQVLIKIQATALNPADWKMRKLGALIDEYPTIVGWDFSGDVEAVGEAVDSLKKGDRVMALSFPPHGMYAFQQYVLMPADLVGKIPDSLDYAQAASIPLGYATAAIGLLAAAPAGAGLDPTCAFEKSFAGQPVFVFGGSSSVGQFALQVLREYKFSPIITYASAKHTDFLKSLGATHVIDRNAVPTASVPETVRLIAGPGASFKIVFDAISEPDTQEACFQLLSSEGGTAVAILGGEEHDINGRKLIHVMGSPHLHREFGTLMWKTLAKQVAEGIIVPNRVEKLPNGLAGIVDGLARLENNAVSGVKLVAFPQETA